MKRLERTDVIAYIAERDNISRETAEDILNHVECVVLDTNEGYGEYYTISEVLRDYRLPLKYKRYFKREIKRFKEVIKSCCN